MDRERVTSLNLGAKAKRGLSKPMLMRTNYLKDREHEHHKETTWTTVFLDLVFAACVAQLGSAFRGDDTIEQSDINFREWLLIFGLTYHCWSFIVV